MPFNDSLRYKVLWVFVYITLPYVTLSEPANKLQYVLMWTLKTNHPFYECKTGQEGFIERKCPITDCYLTSQRDFFGGDVTKFDAIVFNGRDLPTWHPSDLPKKRSPHQKYIFLDMESSDTELRCDPIYDGFFNWTATYKIASDIAYSYILIKNMAGEEVGPKINMTWIDPMSDINETVARTFENKTKAAAWFLSHCNTRGQREKYAENLKNVLKKKNMVLDIYGKCGDLHCPRSNQDQCNDMLREQYFFYLSFENSFSEDYVTEKLLTALNNSVIPIVYGAANYSRFLPPRSYLDARSHTPQELASLMASIIASPAAFREFFRWRNHYTYQNPDNVCRFCAVLNDKTLQKTHKVYQDFRSWWNPEYQQRCLSAYPLTLSSSTTPCSSPWLALPLFGIRCLVLSGRLKDVENALCRV